MGLQVFRNDLFIVALKLDNGEIVFDAECVARSLGFVQMKNEKEYVRWETVNKYLNKNFSQDVGKGDFIPEAAVYKLAFKASNEVAEKFQDWLAVDVLPSIRKHGMYAKDELLDNPDLLIQVATKLKEEKAARLEAEKKIDIMKPKAAFFDAVADSKTAIEIGSVANVLAIPGLGRNKLFRLLRDKGILKENNEPYRDYIDRGYFRVVEQKYNKGDGSTHINIKTLVYQKGVDYIRKIAQEVV